MNHPQAETARTILTIDDHELVRMGLRAVIAQRFGQRFNVADAQSLEDALLYLSDRAHEVVLLLLDLNLSDTRGLAGLRLLNLRYPQIPIVVVSGMYDPRVREEALGCGAVAYFCKTGDGDSLAGLVETVERIADGRLPASDSAAGRSEQGGTTQIPEARSRLVANDPSVKLNSRQVQVLELILSGHDNHAIAHETGLALGSVKNCVSTIFLSFNVRSRAELIRLFAS